MTVARAYGFHAPLVLTRPSNLDRAQCWCERGIDGGVVVHASSSPRCACGDSASADGAEVELESEVQPQHTVRLL